MSDKMHVFFSKLKTRIAEYLELIKFEHTIFALPFALSGMLLAKQNGFPDFLTFVWVLLAMTGGRTAAMALNRLIDADIDAKNPRTSNRAIPAGRIKKISALVLTVICFMIMIFAVWQLPLICKQLLPLAIFIIVIYSYAKRFTSLSHFVLGSALGAAASGGWLAVSGEITAPVVLWGLAVVFWVAGFDTIYALQDAEFDRKHKLFSIPAKFSAKNSLMLSEIFHIISVLMLLSISLVYVVNMFYLAGLAFMAGMLIYGHTLIKKYGMSKINEAFFKTNGYVSIGFMIFILAGKIWN
jgi:4-hydroxybenzoate polyprenyltransferase